MQSRSRQAQVSDAYREPRRSLQRRELRFRSSSERGFQSAPSEQRSLGNFMRTNVRDSRSLSPSKHSDRFKIFSSAQCFCLPKNSMMLISPPYLRRSRHRKRREKCVRSYFSRYRGAFPFCHRHGQDTPAQIHRLDLQAAASRLTGHQAVPVDAVDEVSPSASYPLPDGEASRGGIG